MNFRVRLTRDAEADLERSFDFVLARELGRAGGNLELAEETVIAIRAGVETLKTSPFACRKAGQSPFLRELIIPFGRSGYVALFEIVDTTEVIISAVRHQVEEDSFQPARPKAGVMNLAQMSVSDSVLLFNPGSSNPKPPRSVGTVAPHYWRE